MECCNVETEFCSQILLTKANSVLSSHVSGEELSICNEN